MLVKKIFVNYCEKERVILSKVIIAFGCYVYGNIWNIRLNCVWLFDICKCSKNILNNSGAISGHNRRQTSKVCNGHLNHNNLLLIFEL